MRYARPRGNLPVAYIITIASSQEKVLHKQHSQINALGFTLRYIYIYKRPFVYSSICVADVDRLS